MKIKKAGGERRWLNFKYEKLSMFCFFGGIIGHSDSFCGKRFDSPRIDMEMPYGTWLRTTTRATGTIAANRWLGFDSQRRKAMAATRRVCALNAQMVGTKREGREGKEKWKRNGEVLMQVSNQEGRVHGSHATRKASGSPHESWRDR